MPLRRGSPSPRLRRAADPRQLGLFTAPDPPASARRRAPLRPQGKTLDLRALCAELERRHFGGALGVTITWGRGAAACDSYRSRRGRRRRARRPTLQLGCFDHERRLVRIHPALDAPTVPRYVVESIVYHELLHAALPPIERRGRRRLVHSPEFRRRERLFPDHARAERWIARHLPDLLRARRPG